MNTLYKSTSNDFLVLRIRLTCMPKINFVVSKLIFFQTFLSDHKFFKFSTQKLLGLGTVYDFLQIYVEFKNAKIYRIFRQNCKYKFVQN